MSKDENIVCLNLGGLYNALQKDAHASSVGIEYGLIRKDGYYYDFFSWWSNLRLCCDGEECKVLEQTDEYVKLIDVDNIDDEDLEGIDTAFKLTIDEFKIATL